MSTLAKARRSPRDTNSPIKSRGIKVEEGFMG